MRLFSTFCKYLELKNSLAWNIQVTVSELFHALQTFYLCTGKLYDISQTYYLLIFTIKTKRQCDLHIYLLSTQFSQEGYQLCLCAPINHMFSNQSSPGNLSIFSCESLSLLLGISLSSPGNLSIFSCESLNLLWESLNLLLGISQSSPGNLS